MPAKADHPPERAPEAAHLVLSTGLLFHVRAPDYARAAAHVRELQCVQPLPTRAIVYKRHDFEAKDGSPYVEISVLFSSLPEGQGRALVDLEGRYVEISVLFSSLPEGQGRALVDVSSPEGVTITADPTDKGRTE